MTLVDNMLNIILLTVSVYVIYLYYKAIRFDYKGY